MTADFGREASLAQARSYLRGADPALAQLIDARPEQEVLAIAEKWRPYRSLATSYLSPPPSNRPRRRSPRAKPRTGRDGGCH